MSQTGFRLALVSVSDKTGLVEFLQPLVDRGLQVLSTGGTARHLRDNGFSVKDVSEFTDFPEVMDGRVKTLHPHVHMSILARDYKDSDLQTLEKYQIPAIDLVVGNLYPFESASKKNLSDRELSEFIDIGGPSFLRGAAKNFDRIAAVCDPEDYPWICEKVVSGEGLNLNDRKNLSAKVFYHISSYDSMIAHQLSSSPEVEYSIGGRIQQKLRYGENPHQEASWYRVKGQNLGLQCADILQGKQLSYNNLLDLEAAVRSLRSFGQGPAVVAVKHNNPCGVGFAESLSVATARALAADPVSVFGGIVALNGEVGEEVAIQLTSLFLECVVAPSFDDKALSILSKKKNLRVLAWKGLLEEENSLELRSVMGGLLIQQKDSPFVWNEDWKVVGEEPSSEIRSDLEFSWNVCAHLKSNAIAICENGQSLGLGMGQVNRVDAVRQAITRMQEFHPECRQPVLASDAFFPFADSMEEIEKAGIRWVIQPGGSIRDQEVLARAQELGVNLVLTGQRHFRH